MRMWLQPSAQASLCALATVCYAINANTVNKWLRDQHPAGVYAGIGGSYP